MTPPTLPSELKEATIEHLRRARGLLTDVGWCQGQMRAVVPRYDAGIQGYLECTTAYCLLGALRYSNAHPPGPYGTHGDCPGCEQQDRTVEELALGMTVPLFNDAFGRTKDDVLKVIDDTIERLSR